MINVYRQIEKGFEWLTSIAIRILGNSITFILALVLVILWLTNKLFFEQDQNDKIGDIIQGITFLSLFIIQKSFKRFSALLHVKVNELVASHEPASNAVIGMASKTDHEIMELLDGYSQLAEKKKDEEGAGTDPKPV